MTDKEKMDYSYRTFPYQKLALYPTVRKHHTSYYNVACAFDIETTSIYCPYLADCPHMRTGTCGKEKCPQWITPSAFMYHWQFCADDMVCMGRTWEEFTVFYAQLHKVLHLGEGKKLAVYVHNLGFEFQFLRSVIPLTEVFARKERQPIRATSNGIEWRCSYYLSNMSLKKFCENTPGVDHKKLGDFDYTKIRTATTPLTTEEQDYCRNDVVGLCECINHLLEEDTITSIPMTSTGYVRRECRQAVLSNPKNKKIFLQNQLTLDQYKACGYARRGGDTHANALYSGQVLTDMIGKDISSSYPARMMLEKFPQRFVKANTRRLREWIKSSYAVLFRVMLSDVEKREPYGTPYLAISNTQNIRGVQADNGRVLSCDYIDMWVTDVDWKIIEQQYRYKKILCVSCYIAKYDYLPEELRQVVMKYFRAKTELKGIKEKKYEYMKSKNKLNAIFGMMLTDIIGEQIDYDVLWHVTKDISEDVQEDLLKKYYKNRNSFLSYQHGVWIPAYARKELHRALSICESAYNDTDSVKTWEIYEAAFEKLNAEIMNEIDAAPLPPVIECNGKTYAMGIWEPDGEYDKFITWGAKKYAYIKKGESVVHTTVAGLSKKEGSELVTQIGIENFKPGLVFYPSGRLNAFYNDEVEPKKIVIDGCEMTAGSYIAMVPGTYTLGITEEYKELIGYDVNL